MVLQKYKVNLIYDIVFIRQELFLQIINVNRLSFITKMFKSPHIAPISPKHIKKDQRAFILC